jgi:hypothetical protein
MVFASYSLDELVGRRVGVAADDVFLRKAVRRGILT